MDSCCLLQVGHHTERLCPLTVTDCEYSAIGCTIKFQRRDSQAHIDAFKDNHLHLACKKLVDIVNDNPRPSSDDNSP
ncbi:hypothetical protein OS493_031597 [Desmophyllum pertusum]|uniref:Uncharacterized protein n=1 Tax=Desmophyllum pertusum TaxID=174260 RepID=A0A9W9YJI8_9CNID|nr:hypothetical protein OS493_031597 [Desmophyllum pertusum]